MKYTSAAAVSTVAFFLSWAAPGYAAALSALNANFVTFNADVSEADLIIRGIASVAIGSNTNIYIGTNQVSANNQDPIVISFTNGVRDWVQSYDTSGIDARGIGLLWDEASANLYGVFTADGGSTGEHSFSAATQAGWLTSYGPGGSSKASVLLALDADSGLAKSGTYIRSQLSNGKTNTVTPTELDFVNGSVVFFGNAFFTPLDTEGTPFVTKAEDAGSPFPYRVVFTDDLSQALKAESIGWDGVTAFSAVVEGSSEETVGEDSGTSVDNAPPTPTDDVASPRNLASEEKETQTKNTSEPNVAGNPGEAVQGRNAQSIPEPGIVLGLVACLLGAGRLRRGQVTPKSLGNMSPQTSINK